MGTPLKGLDTMTSKTEQEVRVTEDQGRKVFYIEVGDLPPAQVETLLKVLTEEVRKARTLEA